MRADLNVKHWFRPGMIRLLFRQETRNAVSDGALIGALQKGMRMSDVEALELNRFSRLSRFGPGTASGTHRHYS
jgi:hypothetical protein